MLKTLIGLSILMMFLGCTAPQSDVDGSDSILPDDTSGSDVPECSVVTITEPYTETICWNVTYTEEKCEKKALEFSLSTLTKTDLCTQDGSCVGRDLVECPHTCTGAMKRCRMDVTNMDEEYAGLWVVGANFTRGKSGFIKDPEGIMIPPGESRTFDFTQLYTLGKRGSSMECELFVIDSPEVEVCYLVGHEDTECEEATKYRTVEKEICE
jgi:hypothetical protein